jgi:hypothetical protein
LTLNDDEKSVISAIIDLIDRLPGGQPPYYSMFRKFATIAHTHRWQDPERTNHLFTELLYKHNISVFGNNNEDASAEDLIGESLEDETDNELVAKRISRVCCCLLSSTSAHSHVISPFSASTAAY